MKLKLFASMAMLSVFSTSYAGKIIYTDGDWSLEDMSSKKEPNALCRAFTGENAGGAKYDLIFTHPKNKLAPTEIQLYREGKGPSSFVVTLNNGKVISFANSGKNGKVDTFWLVPQDSIALISHLELKKDLIFKPADGSKDVKLDFDYNGFKRVKEKMQEKCLKNAPLIDAEFEESFLTKQDTLNPSLITVDAVKELRRLYFEGYNVHLGILGTRDELAKLTNTFRNQLNESQSLTSLIERITKSDIPETLIDMKENDDLELRKKSELATVSSQIQAQQATVKSAEAVLKKAEDTLAPFQAEHETKQNNATSVRRSASAASARLSVIDSGIRQSQVNIDQLNREAMAVQNHNNRLEGELRIARLELGRAEVEFRNFNPREEVRRRLQTDRAYQDARRDLRPLEDRVQSLERALIDSRGKVLAREAELRACQSKTGYIFNGEAFRIPAQERTPERDQRREERREERRQQGQPGQPTPGQPQQPQQPTPQQPTPEPQVPTPTPTPSTVDCSAQIEAVRIAKVAESDLSNQLNTTKADLRNANMRVDMIGKRIADAVESERLNYENRARGARLRVENIETNMMNNDRRINIISSIEVPREQNLINSLSMERPAVQSQYDRDYPLAARLERELAEFEAKVGWNAKVAAIQTASQNLSSRQNELRNSENLKRSIESVITGCQSSRVRLNQQLTSLQQRKVSSETRLVEVKKSLEPFEAKKGEIESRANDLRNQLAGTAVQFESQLK